MTSYGALIAYDVTQRPITMSISVKISEGVKRIFRENYQLPVASIDPHGDEVIFTFSESVDEETFLRHLMTASPAYYESLAS